MKNSSMLILFPPVASNQIWRICRPLRSSAFQCPFLLLFHQLLLLLHNVAHRITFSNEVEIYWVFRVNIVKSEANLRYKNCSNLFKILRKEIEFWYYHYRNSTKSIWEKKKNVERENVKFWQQRYWIFCAQFCCPGERSVRGVPKVKRKKKLTN